MKGIQQKIATTATYPQKSRAALDGTGEGHTFIRIVENNLTNIEFNKGQLLEYVVSPTNLHKAYTRVVGNKGTSGVDNMDVASLSEYLADHEESLITSILDGSYRPNPVRRVEIPKADGKKRTLGIPTVVDRLIQQSLFQVLSPIYERQFSNYSYGFRPRRNAHQALRQCKTYITDGYKYAVDMDLEKFFDTVNHSKLIEVLSRTIKDGRVISLIHRYLNGGVVIGGKFEDTILGVPQGSPLSPLLGNVMLNELDKELENRGHRFVRYADDMVILCKSKRSSTRTLEHITSFIENKLFLNVNRDKTVISHVSKIKFLGYGFYLRDGCHLRPHVKSIIKMKDRIKSLTSRSNGLGDLVRKEQLRYFITGWVNYFSLARMSKLMQRIDEWYRRRLRMVIWKRWKKVKTRLRNLMKLGLSKQKSWEYSNTRKGYWHIANSWILSTTITNYRLKQAGYLFFSDYYVKVRNVN